MRKFFLLSVVIFSAGIIAAMAQTTTPAKTVEKLAKLKSGYTGAVDRAVTPLKKTYLGELQKLKMEYTKAGDLDSALAVDAEIKSFENAAASAQAASAKGPATVPATPSGAPSSSASADVNTRAEFGKYLLGTVWTVTRASDGYAWGTMEFKENDMLVYNGDKKWSLADKRKVTVSGYTLTFSEDLSKFTVMWGGSGELVGVPRKKTK